MSLTEKLFLVWLRRRLKAWRSDMRLKGLWRALDGWKLIIAVVVGVLASIYDQLTNGHAGDLVGAILTTLGWAPGTEWTGPAITKVAASILGLVAFAHRLLKAQRQMKAGAAVGETLGTAGFVKQAAAEGRITKVRGAYSVPQGFIEIKPEQVSLVAQLVYGLLKILLGGHLKVGKVDVVLPSEQQTIGQGGHGGGGGFSVPHTPGPPVGR